MDDDIAVPRLEQAQHTSDTAAEPPGEPVLHSLAEFRELILECCGLVEARSIVEVGCEWGLTTSVLAEWARANGAAVHCVEPYPTPEFRKVVENHPSTSLIEEFSPAALTRAPPGDVYLLDGDHNYWTVSRELDALRGVANRSGHSPIVFLHDCGWPWARRDIYYAPDRLPADALHPYTFEKGVVLGSSGVVDDGFRSGGSYAIALEEGGPANGVLTAIEDFLEHEPTYSFWLIPPVFGLGVLVPQGRPWSEPVASLVQRWATHPLLTRLEDNRLRLFLRVLELWVQADHAERALAEGNRLLAETNRVLAETEAARREIAHALEMTRARLHELESRADQLAGSRWVRGLARLEGPVRRVRPGLGTVRDRLRAMAGPDPADGGV
jgi:hypothetical protein